MKSYDDMQRFKDKAQIKDINFKEITGPLFQSETPGWPIIKHLSGNQENEDAPLPDQLINITQLTLTGEGVLPGLMNASSPDKGAKPSVSDKSSTLVHSIETMLPQANPSPLVQSAVDVVNTTVVKTAPASTAVKTAPASADVPVVAPVSATPDANRFRHLFTVRDQNDHQSDASPKAVLLKSLLERIASCR
ncbi:cellulose biosynthesis protein BcsO [Prodigiosinella confusarubida]|uniref:Cellulose biosynthesis protein BcsO n=1 Tax=Serratia sp. (strain ATCC 39006) TaxID=104623 RepID=A0A2I5TF72_SERS3|nr:cellulose biosynthesis protein BcsO [Serratia sp. ATCC 39006]AUG98905.1 cellulose biosynthesis protein BcsO [Serratia sp. ATCC 39006]AUH03220.1 cellulose biosynthesis protein BcsO [Serratia sp. ATCC 39006]